MRSAKTRFQVKHVRSLALRLAQTVRGPNLAWADAYYMAILLRL